MVSVSQSVTNYKIIADNEDNEDKEDQKGVWECGKEQFYQYWKVIYGGGGGCIWIKYSVYSLVQSLQY